LTPKEWHGDDLLTPPEHVERSGLTLALGDNPVLDADGQWPTAVRSEPFYAADVR
jgi:hypothetical protein